MFRSAFFRILFLNNVCRQMVRYMPVLFFPLISSLTVIAQGNLMITPRRVVFEGPIKPRN